MAARPTPAERLAEALTDLIRDAIAEAVSDALPPADSALSVSVPEAAERLGLGTTTVKSLIASGELASVRVGDRRLIPVAALEALIAERRPSA